MSNYSILIKINTFIKINNYKFFKTLVVENKNKTHVKDSFSDGFKT